VRSAHRHARRLNPLSPDDSGCRLTLDLVRFKTAKPRPGDCLRSPEIPSRRGLCRHVRERSSSVSAPSASAAQPATIASLFAVFLHGIALHRTRFSRSHRAILCPYARIVRTCVVSERSPYTRFRRSLETQRLADVLPVAAELPWISLGDSLEILTLMAQEADPTRYVAMSRAWGWPLAAPPA
jgi:hypothetical protein